MSEEVLDLYNIVDGYNSRLKKLSSEKGINVKGNFISFRPENVELAIAYLKKREEYLRNVYGVDREAQIRFYKTLSKEITYLQNILNWFNKWSLRDIGEAEIKEVYEGIESGTLQNLKWGKLTDATKKDYYTKQIKHGFFEFIGKNEISKKVILRKFSEFEEVRFFSIEDLRVMSDNCVMPSHKLMFWLMFDTGIEIQAILQLTKRDFTREKDKETNTEYWVLHVRKEISKRNRQRRDLLIYFNETNQLLNSYLSGINDDERLFNYTQNNAHQRLKEYVNKFNLRVKPVNKPITLKDFRSSMATYFLAEQKWNTDEVKARLGHKPSSKVIDRYVSYLGLNQQKKRRESLELDFSNYQEKYQESQETIRNLTAKVDILTKYMEDFKTIYQNPEKRKDFEKLL